MANTMANNPALPSPTKLFRTWRQRVKLLEAMEELKWSERKTCREWAVKRTSLRQWRKKIADMKRALEPLPSERRSAAWNKFLNSRSMTKGRTLATHEEILVELYTFYRHQKELAYYIYDSDLVNKLHAVLYGDGNAEPEGALSDDALRMRIRRWRKQIGIVPRAVTHVGQITEFDPAVIRDFVDNVNHTIETRQIPKDCVVNMDETNMYFDQKGRLTLANKGDKTINATGTGSSQRCTVVLAATLSGEKLPPFVIFKGTPGARGNSVERELETFGYPTSCTFAVQEKAWMDAATFLVWVERNWKPFCAGKEKTILIMDHHTSHLTEECRRAVEECGTEIILIPPGYTSKLQTMDVGINKPFKGYARRRYITFLRNRTSTTELPHRYDVAYWVRDAWTLITEDCIRNTWRHIGIVGFEDRENADPNSPVGMNARVENDNDDMIDFETAEMEALTDTLEGGFDFQ
jgi:DDE superfamily endonuclease